jgi:hypothetical protein
MDIAWYGSSKILKHIVTSAWRPNATLSKIGENIGEDKLFAQTHEKNNLYRY